MNERFVYFFIILFSYSINISCNIPESISLNGTWKFAIDSVNRGVKENWQFQIPAESANDVRVPHTWNLDRGLEEYNGLAWYQKQFDAPASWKGKNIRLKFNAIYRDAIVFINGRKAGEHYNSGYTPFILSIDSLIYYNKSNTIVVSVSNAYSATAFPYNKSFDWANDGGIIRPVSIEITGKPSIQYVHVDPKMSLEDFTGEVFISVKLWEQKIKKANIKFIIKEKKRGNIVITDARELTTKNDVFKTHFNLGKIMPWHFDHPELYLIETSIITKSGISDIKNSVFGFKHIEIKEDKFYLNGENVRLPGIEYMPSSNPYFGAAETPQFMDSVVKVMKDLNVCITRFHWQQDDYLLNLLDEYGILVQEEMPWWQSPGNLSPDLLATAIKQLSENIEAHYNHPCIFSWGISNEVYGNTDKNIFIKLRDFIKSLDSSRLVTVVSNEIFDRKENDESLICDLPTWNEYVGTWHGKDRSELQEKFNLIKDAIDNRPLLITENGLCEPRFAGGDARRIDELLFHTKEWYRQKYVIGFIYFCLNDYRTHIGEEVIGKYKIRRHGITDIYLNPKPSYSVFKQLASPIEIIKVERKNSSSAIIGIKVKNEIPSYTIKDYYLSYLTVQNELEVVSIPHLHPGDAFELELNKINPRFSFSIYRPNGFNVMHY